MGRPKDRVGVRELRQNLSVYLDRVKQGESLFVTEHSHVVAVLRSVAAAEDPLHALVASGRATAARRRPADLPKAIRWSSKVPLSQIARELGEDAV
jgi:prevent-host-death family protein